MTTRWTTSALAITLASATLGGCSKSDNPAYAKDGDTGAAAPATQQSLSPTPSMGDSTTGVSRGTGQPAMAGDTMGAHGKAAGQPNPDSGSKAAKGAPRP